MTDPAMKRSGWQRYPSPSARRSNTAARKRWRRKVLARAKYFCEAAGPHCVGTAIEAHHILGVAEYPEGEYEVDNGLAVCSVCHAEITAAENRARKAAKARKRPERPHPADYL
jgi:5-methylcytosine-specific restriction enzyme A